MREEMRWSNFDRAFRDFERIGRANPLCLGVKTDAGLGGIVLGTIDHLQENGARILQYELESWGRLALIQDRRDMLQSIWDNYGLVSREDWLQYRKSILESLEEMYQPQDKEYSATIRREFKNPIDSHEFEEQLIGDLVARTGDLPKVMYINTTIDNEFFCLRTDFQVSLAGLGLSRSDRAVLYAIDPLIYRSLKKQRPRPQRIKDLVLDLQRIFQASIWYYPGWDLILELGIEDRWYKLEEAY